MSDLPDWTRLLREALQRGVEARGRAIPGAVFHHLLRETAAAQGIEFPPDDPRFKFARFLDGHPEVVAVLRRPGKDILLAPADRPELLVDSSDHDLVGIRNDLFRAFTQVWVTELPWYRRTDDSVTWSKEQPEGLPGEWIAIPRAELESELRIRREFATQLTDSENREILLRTLETEHPLTEFARAVARLRHKAAWHTFRVRGIAERLRRWADETGVDWRDEWLVSDQRATQDVTGDPTIVIEGGQPDQWREVLINLIATADVADLARISVPLDLVVRVLRQR